ncbi:MAG: TonB-dependent receptor plug domain-containing protein [Arcticibacter sp.]
MTTTIAGPAPPKSFLKFLLTLVILYSWGDTYAQEKRGTGSTVVHTDTLHQVQINARFLVAPEKSAVPHQSLKGEQLERLNSLNVADALRFFSGLQVKDYGGIGGLKTVDVRSMGSSHTSVFYDGVQLGNAMNGQTDLSKFSLDNLDELHLYTFQKSDIFQPARAFAAGSSLYLESKVPSFREGKQTNAGVRFRTGSFGLINPSAVLQQKISKNISASLNAEWQQSDGDYKFRYTNGVYDTTAVRQNGDMDALRLEAGFYGMTRDSSQWTLKGYHYRSERGLPRAIVSNNFESDDRLWDRNSFVQASWKSPLNRRFQSMANAKYAYDYTRYLDPDHYKMEGPLDNHYRQKELYLSLANKYRLNQYWNVGLSADWIHNKLDADLEFFAYPTRNTKLVAASSSLDLKTFHLQASLLGTYVSETVEAYESASNFHRYNPAISASWQPFRKQPLLINAFYKETFRMPTFNDLYYSMIGNTALQPERVAQYNAGLAYQQNLQGQIWKSVSVQANAYYNHVKDKIVAIPAENLFRWTMVNLGEVDIRGVESNVRSDLQLSNALMLHLGLNYTYQRAVDVTSGASNYNHQIPYTPLHSGSLTLGADYRKLTLNYSYVYCGERYSQKTNIPVNYIEPWYTHDISCAQILEVSGRKFKIGGELNNIFNQYRDIVLNFPMPGRSFRFTFSTNI